MHAAQAILCAVLIGAVPSLARAQVGTPEGPPPDAGVPDPDAGVADDGAPAAAPEPTPEPAPTAPRVLTTPAEEPPDPETTAEADAETEEAAHELAGMSLEELLTVTVVSANRREERLIDAPAPIVVITAEDIRLRGYTDLTEIFMDLPGFDITLYNGSDYLNAYQRGYRTPYTNRTLFLVNGQVDNTLWWQTALINRQYPLSNIERIEILYGPASVVYGPNAFLGVVNIITRDGRDVSDGEVDARVTAGVGTWKTRFVDLAFNTRWGDISVAFSARVHRSDEPDLSSKWYWLDNRHYGNIDIWGPLLDRTRLPDSSCPMPPCFTAGLEPGEGNTLLPGVEHEGIKLGHYHDPTDDYGMIGTVKARGLTLGLINWHISEGYGAQYTADHAQNDTYWIKDARTVYGQYEARPSRNLTSTSLLLYRESDYGGDFAEAYPDWNPMMERYSYVSYSLWNADSNSTLFRQILDYELLDGDLVLTGGLTFERKDLAKNYDISGYWSDAFSSVSTGAGPAGLGPGVVHSTSTEPYDVAAPPPDETPRINRVLTTDQGGFAAANIALGRYRIIGGIRYDHNSLYGSSVNPRVAFIMRMLEDTAAVKLIAGTAFQEPPPGLLFGGWNGRAANPELEPERAYDADLVLMLQRGRFYGDLSAFYAHYTHVITEEQSRNQGTRDAFGGELKVRATAPNPIPRTTDLELWANLTTTFSYSSIAYDFATATFVRDRTPVGDIAPVKAHLGLSCPLAAGLHATLRSNLISGRKLYLRNALRDPRRPDGGRELDAYMTLDGFVGYEHGPLRLGVLGRNLLGADYFHPGVEQADSGDDFTAARSGGFRNSLVPQPGRSVMLTLGLEM